MDQLIRANAVSLAKGNFAPAILADDRDGAIRRILERTLRIKKILQRHGREETIKNILIDFVKSYCHLINLRHGFYTLCDDTLDDDDMPLCDCAELPYTLHLPNICHRPDMWRSYDLERHPEKIINLPLPIFYDARGRAKYHALSATERGDGTVEDARQGKQISEASG